MARYLTLVISNCLEQKRQKHVIKHDKCELRIANCFYTLEQTSKSFLIVFSRRFLFYTFLHFTTSSLNKYLSEPRTLFCNQAFFTAFINQILFSAFILYIPHVCMYLYKNLLIDCLSTGGIEPTAICCQLSALSAYTFIRNLPNFPAS